MTSQRNPTASQPTLRTSGLAKIAPTANGRAHMSSRVVMVVAVGIVCTWAFPSSAHAYVDPGTGSYIVQIVIASVLGALAIARIYWSKLMNAARGVRKKNRQAPSNDS